MIGLCECVFFFVWGSVYSSDVKKSARYCCGSAVSGEVLWHKHCSTIIHKWADKWKFNVLVCLCGLFDYVCNCILLVWLITEVVTHNPKCACISVCSLHRKDRKKRVYFQNHNNFPKKFYSKFNFCCPSVLLFIQILSFVSHLLLILFHLFSFRWRFRIRCCCLFQMLLWKLKGGKFAWYCELPYTQCAGYKVVCNQRN